MLAESLLVALGMFSFRPPTAQAATISAQLPLARYVAPQYRAPVRRDLKTIGVDTTGKAAILMDVKSGTILFERNSEAAYPIASLTKLMTAMVILDAKLPMDEELAVLDEDEPGPLDGKPVLEGGQAYSRQELLRALLVGSVNTAGNTLARTYPGGREAFVKDMNTKAIEIGLGSAVFYEPTGLDHRNVASAQDVAQMLQRALMYSDIRNITENTSISLKDHRSPKITNISSTNLLLNSFLNKKPYHIVAAKTGSLPEAGFCLAQATEDANGNELIGVTLGSTDHFSRYQDVKALTAWGFEAFKWE